MSDTVTRLNAALEGRYAIERELGEGGMATVYLADDLKHERKVALKVLKPELAAVVGAERFLAEIKTTANLQHPHILPLFDSGEADSFLFYVMPYVEGETLRDRIDREKHLPVDEAVALASKVAGALQHAHEHGVIHRDIKPANILLQDGEPVVADFGIALAVGAAGSNRLTETGLSIGTPYYMSPEQATGDQEVGPSTDTYALGSVLYEMLTGDPPYMGSTAQAVLGQIISGRLTAAMVKRPSIPPNVDAAIRKALERLPADRFNAAAEFAKVLADPGFRHGEVVGTGAGATVGPWNRLTTAATALAGVLAVALGWSLLQPEPSDPTARFESPFRASQAPIAFSVASFNLSPDGSMLIYMGPSETAASQLWMRRWDDLDASPIRGTEGGGQPAVSSDNQQLAFVQGGEVKVLSFAGGPTHTLIRGIYPRWGPDGYIYARTDSGAARVPATGGPMELVTRMAEGEGTLWIGDFLSGGEDALVRVGMDDGTSEIHALRVETGERRMLTNGTWPKYAASGHLTFLTALTEGGTLMAAPFDAGAMEITGPAVPIVEGVSQYALSERGDLVYTTIGTTGPTVETDSELVWVTRDGTVTPVGWAFVYGIDTNYSWRLSPDGTQVALRHRTVGNNDIWVKELPDGLPRRLTFGTGADYFPSWTPDGLTITYVLAGNVWTVAADGTGEPTLLFDGARDMRAGEWSPDGEWLVLRTEGNRTGQLDQANRDIMALRPGRDSVPSPLVATVQFAEDAPALSPDGRWLAFASDETGSVEVWVRPFPDVQAGKYRVSAEGGRSPRWAHSGRELFYLGADSKMVAAEIDTSSGFRVVGSETLFTVPVDFLLSAAADPFDVAPDDQRFLMARSYTERRGPGGPAYVLVQSFFEELKRLVPN